jgi:hypothetical protein
VTSAFPGTGLLLLSSTGATEQMAGVAEVNETAKPEVDVAVTIIDVKLIVCPALVITMLPVLELPVWLASPA